MIVIAFNGPPGCGKDTCTGILHRQFNFQQYKFATPIRKAMAGTFDIPLDEVEGLKNRELIPGITGRKWMIDFSENLMKPLLGLDCFAVLCAARLRARGNPSRVAISDCGFDYEWDAFRNAIPHYEHYLVQVYREGCTFASDSRSYISRPAFRLENNGSLSELEKKLIHFLTSTLRI